VLHRLQHFSEVEATCRGGVVSIGNFDGVHRGHVLLVEGMRELVRALGGPTVALTFDPHPVSLLRPDQTPVPLTTIGRRSELLHFHGVAEVIVMRTDSELLNLTADEFFDRVIRGSLAAKGLVEGPNFGFGRGRSGTITTLNRLCAASGMQLEVADPVVIEGQVVSSSRIRQCLHAGEVDIAETLLGRPHRICGRVVRGAGRGASLGFPTANLKGIANLIPGDGVYACRTEIGGKPWPVAAHIGPNATFGESERSVEAHVLGFQGELVGSMFPLDFLRRLRGTQRFAGADELVQQMRRDVEQARAIFASSTESPADPRKTKEN
jgi:riboflavin kinase/FMN adenylyltransferase